VNIDVMLVADKDSELATVINTMNPDDLAEPLDPLDPTDEDTILNEDLDSSTAVTDMDELEEWILKALMGASCAAVEFSDAISKTLALYTDSYYNKQPYHTSILTGHPDHIQCELGVCHHVFYVLLSLLHNLGCCDSKYVSLEEQLAIFCMLL
jgi:hypothetical protein